MGATKNPEPRRGPSIDDVFKRLDRLSRTRALTPQESMKLEQLVREIDYRDRCAARGKARRG